MFLISKAVAIRSLGIMFLATTFVSASSVNASADESLYGAWLGTRTDQKVVTDVCVVKLEPKGKFHFIRGDRNKAVPQGRFSQGYMYGKWRVDGDAVVSSDLRYVVGKRKGTQRYSPSFDIRGDRLVDRRTGIEFKRVATLDEMKAARKATVGTWVGQGKSYQTRTEFKADGVYLETAFENGNDTPFFSKVGQWQTFGPVVMAIGVRTVEAEKQHHPRSTVSVRYPNARFRTD